MTDGTIIVRVLVKYEEINLPIVDDDLEEESHETYQALEDFKEINMAEGIIDINSFEDCLVILKKDGTFLVAEGTFLKFG
jgi:hypothetical protein